MLPSQRWKGVRSSNTGPACGLVWFQRTGTCVADGEDECRRWSEWRRPGTFRGCTNQLNPQQQVMTLLHKNSSELLRQKRHFVFTVRNGQRWVTPETPGGSQ